MNLISALLILVLATYEISWLLYDTSKGGPYDILSRFRHFAGVRYDDKSIPYGTNVVSSAMLCMYCSSFWIGIAMAILYIIVREPLLYVMLPLAINGAIIFMLKGDER
jgi:hypothetical protein